MHKILVHAQDSCACARILCMHKSLSTVVLLFVLYSDILTWDPSRVVWEGLRSILDPLKDCFVPYIQNKYWVLVLPILVYYCLLLPIKPSRSMFSPILKFARGDILNRPKWWHQVQLRPLQLRPEAIITVVYNLLQIMLGSSTVGGGGNTICNSIGNSIKKKTDFPDTPFTIISNFLD